MSVFRYCNCTVSHDCHVTVQVSDIKFSLSRDPAHENHGLVIEVKGYKPSALSEPVHLSLNVEGGGFWGVASRAFGEFPVNLARYVINTINVPFNQYWFNSTGNSPVYMYSSN